MEKYLEVLIYTWPYSQLCMECKHGEFVDSHTFDACSYICWKHCEKNNGTECPKYEKDA